MFWAGITDLARKKKGKKKKPKNAATEKPNVEGFSCVSKCNPKMVYSCVLEKAAIGLSLQPCFKNATIGQGYNCVLNAA